MAFSVSDVIPAPPRAIDDAWLDSEGRAAMTGGKQATCPAAVGGVVTVWNGYIIGQNLALELVGSGTRLTVSRRNVPDGHTKYRDGDWQRSDFEPMKAYFAARP
ncbi:MAG: hypothetical protein ACREEA_09470 [Stellaceae bacterium]